MTSFLLAHSSKVSLYHIPPVGMSVPLEIHCTSGCVDAQVVYLYGVIFYIVFKIFPLLKAFREMSHKFHGKGSGKKKLERRMKKVKDDQVKLSF